MGFLHLVFSDWEKILFFPKFLYFSLIDGLMVISKANITKNTTNMWSVRLLHCYKY